VTSVLQFTATFGVLWLALTAATLLIVAAAATVDWVAVRTGQRSPLQHRGTPPS
jgi:hypothetical protein